MYQIPHEEFYKLYDTSVNDIVNYFYSKEELIKFIAKWYHYDGWIDNSYHFPHYYNNTFISQCTCDIKELNNKLYIIYDNFDRIINIHDFENDALNFYHTFLETKNYDNVNYLPMWLWKQYKKNKRYKHNTYKKIRTNYIYRQTPVPYTKKFRGGPHWSTPRTAKLFRMYANPDYKEFNRGSKKGIPNWWDDRIRIVQKSWKEQTKNKHQWEKHLNRRNKKDIYEADD